MVAPSRGRGIPGRTAAYGARGVAKERKRRHADKRRRADEHRHADEGGIHDFPCPHQQVVGGGPELVLGRAFGATRGPATTVSTPARADDAFDRWTVQVPVRCNSVEHRLIATVF